MLRSCILAPIALTWSAVAWAQAYDPAKLDPLFARLEVARSPEAAQPVIAAIWMQWTDPGDSEQKLLMQLGLQQKRVGELPAAIETFTRLTGQVPQQPEPWYERGTVHLLQGEQSAAIADFCAALKREPRHFAAYSNLGIVYVQKDEPARAVVAFGLSLKHNPQQPRLRAEMERIEADLTAPAADGSVGCDRDVAGR
jgi:Flp pilus assembly protein TadD